MSYDQLFDETNIIPGSESFINFNNGVIPIGGNDVHTYDVTSGQPVTIGSANNPHDQIRALKNAILAIDSWTTTKAVWRLKSTNCIVSELDFALTDGGTTTAYIRPNGSAHFSSMGNITYLSTFTFSYSTLSNVIAQFDSAGNFIPVGAGSKSIGLALNMWNDVQTVDLHATNAYITSLSISSVSIDTITANNNLYANNIDAIGASAAMSLGQINASVIQSGVDFVTNASANLGSVSYYWNYLYVTNIIGSTNISCPDINVDVIDALTPGATRFVTNVDFCPAIAGAGGQTLGSAFSFWTGLYASYVYVTNVRTANIDTATPGVIDIGTTNATTVISHVDIWPNSGQNLGDTTKHWNYLWVDNIVCDNISARTGAGIVHVNEIDSFTAAHDVALGVSNTSQISAYVDVIPWNVGVTPPYPNLGSATHYWNNLWVDKAYANTLNTSTSNNLVIGDSGITLQITLFKSIFPTPSNSLMLGNSSYYFNNIYTANACIANLDSSTAVSTPLAIGVNAYTTEVNIYKNTILATGMILKGHPTGTHSGSTYNIARIGDIANDPTVYLAMDTITYSFGADLLTLATTGGGSMSIGTDLTINGIINFLINSGVAPTISVLAGVGTRPLFVDLNGTLTITP